MSDRTVSEAVARRLGPDAIGRLRSLRRRLWWRRAVRAGILVLAATVLCVALVQLLSRAFPFEFAPYVQIGVVGVGALAWTVMVIRSRPSLVEAARRADEELALRQRLGTALELAGHEADDPLEVRQLDDARARLNAVDLRRAFRPRLARRPLAVVGIGLAMTLLLVAWPNPQDDVVAQRRAAREAAERVAERVEDVADEVGEKNVENPDPRREELERQLRELARQLREQGAEREATLARIGSVQEELSRMTDPQAAERDAGLTQLARSTSRAATGDEEANDEGDPGAGGQRPRRARRSDSRARPRGCARARCRAAPGGPGRGRVSAAGRPGACRGGRCARRGRAVGLRGGSAGGAGGPGARRRRLPPVRARPTAPARRRSGAIGPAGGCAPGRSCRTANRRTAECVRTAGRLGPARRLRAARGLGAARRFGPARGIRTAGIAGSAGGFGSARRIRSTREPTGQSAGQSAGQPAGESAGQPAREPAR